MAVGPGLGRGGGRDGLRAVEAMAGAVGRALVARQRAPQALRGGRDVLGAHAAAAADDLRALLAPAQRHLGVLLAAHAGREAPAAIAVVAEVGIDADRQVGEVAQVGDHARHVVGRDAVDEQRGHAHLLEAARRAAEGVALGAAPVLAVDAAQAVAAAPEGQPHGQAGRQQALDRRVEGGREEREGLEQHEVGRLGLVGEHAREEPGRLGRLVGVDVAVEREGDRALAVALELVDGLAGEAQPAAPDVHPVHGRLAVRPQARAVGRHRRGEAPGVGRDDVAAGLDVLAVHAQHGVGALDQRSRAPQRLVERVLGLGGVRQLGADASVEDHAALLGDRPRDVLIGARRPP